MRRINRTQRMRWANRSVPVSTIPLMASGTIYGRVNIWYLCPHVAMYTVRYLTIRSRRNPKILGGMYQMIGAGLSRTCTIDTISSGRDTAIVPNSWV